jgi:hypothetical protein
VLLGPQIQAVVDIPEEVHPADTLAEADIPAVVDIQAGADNQAVGDIPEEAHPVDTQAGADGMHVEQQRTARLHVEPDV